MCLLPSLIFHLLQTSGGKGVGGGGCGEGGFMANSGALQQCMGVTERAGAEVISTLRAELLE